MPQPPKKLRDARPSVGDLLSSVVEFIQWVLDVLLLQDLRNEPKKIAAALFVLAVLVALTVPILTRRPEALVAWIVLGIVLWVHGRDISRARSRLRAVVAQPNVELPELEARVGLSSTVTHLDNCSKAFSAAARGQCSAADLILQRIDRNALDGFSRRVLDATFAICLVSSGKIERACSCALVSIPIGNPDIDLALGICVLRQSWQSAERLHAIRNKWRDEADPLMLLSMLAGMRFRFLSGETEPELEIVLAPKQLELLAEVAGKLGDDLLASRILRQSKRLSPYR